MVDFTSGSFSAAGAFLTIRLSQGLVSVIERNRSFTVNRHVRVAEAPTVTGSKTSHKMYSFKEPIQVSHEWPTCVHCRSVSIS